MENERCHVTVVGTRRRVDLAVPADAAIAEYTPTLLDLVGQVEFDDTFPPVWSLAMPGTSPFPPEASLRECGVVDGATLYLRDMAAGEFDEPVVTDLEEAVEQIDGVATAWGWRPRAFTILVLGVLSLVAGFATLAWTDQALPATGAGAIAGASLLTVLAWHATRQGWSLPLGLRLIMAYSAVPLAAVAAASLPAATTSTTAVLLAVSVGTVIGSLAAVLAIRHATTLMAVAISISALLLTVCLALGGASLPQSSAVVGVFMMVVLGVAPKIAGHTSVLAGSHIGGAEAYGDESDVLHLVRRGQRLLVGLNTLASLLSAACLVILGTSDQPFAVALAGCLGLALVLRAGRVTIAVAVVPVVTAGTIGLAVTLIHAPETFGAPAGSGSFALIAAAVVALLVGLSRAFRADRADGRPAWIDPLGGLFLLAAVPLAVGVFGVYASLLNSGQTP
ncbi:type VII secretion integral membrane protein EccD [Peterkaempfera griseoplana]|uniref:type VII secretion integral membrane protein EccD n=1 Tax=Peterkaempfera griseoplana TaxID=66896 RepID=UPI0006E40472|nr:type VII secretion integral membrane protein EccD [Peterkaempfera griseoplana]